MSMGTLAMVAAATGGRLIGADRAFDAVSTDTRTLAPGDLFFALRGERFDAAAFVADAARRGAAGAVVDAGQPAALAQIEVADPLAALGALARDWRARFRLPVIGVTGSNGKTTVKEMLACILRSAFGGDAAVLATRGNLNNEIGLPLTVLRLSATHRAAVLEMGAGKSGDIAYLADIGAPDIGVVTNAGPAHLAGFGDEDTVAATKGEMFEALAEGQIAVVNHDDVYASFWRELAAPAEVRTFGLASGAAYRALDVTEAGPDAVRPGIRFRIAAPSGEFAVRLQMTGQHNVMNALAAAAAADAAGASVDAIRAGLEAVRNVGGRLLPLAGVGGMTLVDDAYNANPVSVGAAIDMLAARGGETWLVLGDMAELGTRSAALHRAVGERARQAGISRLWCYGEEVRAAADAFGTDARMFSDRAALADALRADARHGVTVLVKGSRSMGLERVVDALRADASATSGETKQC